MEEEIIVLSVSKCFSHRGRNIRHRTSTGKIWKVLGISPSGKFRTKRISPIEVPFWKAKKKKIITFQCTGCGFKFRSVEKKPKCPSCG